MDQLPFTDGLARKIYQACYYEAKARKPGNVHPAASFQDLQFEDFVRSAEVISPILAQAETKGVGTVILESVQATQQHVGQNTNLGILLLLAPLAAVPLPHPLTAGIHQVLQNLSLNDAKLVYQAIRSAAPGGLGDVTEGDVKSSPSGTLLEMMSLATQRDTIAKQYGSNFDLVLNFGVKTFLTSVRKNLSSDTFQEWEIPIIMLALELLAREADSLILRKCGIAIANEASMKAIEVLEAGWPETSESVNLFDQFDAWLRADGHRRNPGTTADLVASVLFTVFREELWSSPITSNLHQ